MLHMYQYNPRWPKWYMSLISVADVARPPSYYISSTDVNTQRWKQKCTHYISYISSTDVHTKHTHKCTHYISSTDVTQTECSSGYLTLNIFIWRKYFFKLVIWRFKHLKKTNEYVFYTWQRLNKKNITQV